MTRSFQAPSALRRRLMAAGLFGAVAHPFAALAADAWPAKPVRLSKGDVALVGVDGTLTELTASGAAPGTVRVADTDGPAGTLQRLWQNSSDWGLPLGIGAAALFFLLLIRASQVRRRGN